jgi:hypothetical protein
VYSLVYSPLVATGNGNGNGNNNGNGGYGYNNNVVADQGTVTFYDDVVGEFTYLLNLRSTPIEPVRLERQSCQAGTRATLAATVTNPLGERIEFAVAVSNPQNYAVVPRRVVAGPYATVPFEIVYTPSSIGEPEAATVTLSHPRAGEWTFLAEGVGEPPSQLEVVEIEARVREATTHVIAFRNPFPSQLDVEVTLAPWRHSSAAASASAAATGDVVTAVTGPRRGSALGDARPTEHDKFSLLLRRRNLSLGPFGAVQLPVSFAPSAMRRHRARVVVRGPSGLEWIYPLAGVPVCPPTGAPLRFSCRARERIEEQFDVLLAGVREDAADTHEERFDWSLRPAAGEAASAAAAAGGDADAAAAAAATSHAALERAFQITPLTTAIRRAGDPLRFSAVLEPLRPLDTRCVLAIDAESGGRWLFDVQVRASRPKVDDTIVIEAPLGGSSSVAFRVANPFPTRARFEAVFHATKNSGISDIVSQLAVFPTEGVMAPAGGGGGGGGDHDDDEYSHDDANNNGDGTEFVVNYTPARYGRPLEADLLIQTDDMVWTYRIRGVFPTYHPPSREDAASRVDTHLSAEGRRRLDEAHRPSRSAHRRR